MGRHQKLPDTSRRALVCRRGVARMLESTRREPERSILFRTSTPRCIIHASPRRNVHQPRPLARPHKLVERGRALVSQASSVRRPNVPRRACIAERKLRAPGSSPRLSGHDVLYGKRCRAVRMGAVVVACVAICGYAYQVYAKGQRSRGQGYPQGVQSTSVRGNASGMCPMVSIALCAVC